MASTNECKWQTLTELLGHGGHVSDLALEYFQGLVTTRHAVTPLAQISDLMQQLFILDGFIDNRADGAYLWLKGEGAIGDQINDLWNDYWCRVVAPVGPFDDGFSDGFG